jgi:hypothetical protein
MTTMTKKTPRASKTSEAFTAEQLDLAARRYRLRSGVRAGKAGTGPGKVGGKGFVSG